MNKKELNRILTNHLHWLNRNCDGWESMRADLTGANLSETDLSETDLSDAILTGAILTGAILTGAILTGANLSDAILYDANLTGANLTGANLSDAILSDAILSDAILTGANLSDASLTDANLTGANLSDAILIGANLTGANLYKSYLHGAILIGTRMEKADIYNAFFDRNEEIRKGIVLKKPIKGYKKTVEGVVITAEIPAGAIVFSINGKKCRTNIATITDTAGHKLLHSQYDREFTYKTGKKIIIDNFDTRYNIECATGFHFFLTKKEAKAY